MKRICPCCHKKYVLNKRKRKAEIKSNLLPQGTETYCEPCIADIASIEAEYQAAFWGRAYHYHLIAAANHYMFYRGGRDGRNL